MTDTFIDLAAKLQELDVKNDPAYAAKLIAWIKAGGLESMKPTLLAYLEAKVKPKLIELRVARLDREDEKFYPVTEAHTVGDLRQAIAQEEKLPLGELLIRHVGPVDLKSNTPHHTRNLGDLKDDVKLGTLEADSVLIVYPTQGRDTWGGSLPSDGQTQSSGGAVKTLHWGPETTVGQLKRRIWMLYGMPLSNQHITAQRTGLAQREMADDELFDPEWRANATIGGLAYMSW
ncbi:Hypothetical protein POVN_LOCUS703 [uncultured virus]|nr:Hypothetical protein POVN_LOCUS703 [uncultured virus]